MAEEYIIGSNAQFNENVDILGKLNLFDSINQIEKFVLNLDSKEKLRITPDSITFTDNLTAPSGNFTGIVTATKFSGPFEGTTGNFSGDVTIGGVLTYEDVTNVDSVGLITARSGINVTGTVTATSFSGVGAFVSGMIVLWSGAANAIPTGFVLCDGNNNTPDLRDRFVVGAGSGYAVNATGGSANATLPYHYHNYPGDDQLTFGNGVAGWASNHDGGFNYDATSTNSGGGKLWRTTAVGESAVNKNLPPYYALCYIMKT